MRKAAGLVIVGLCAIIAGCGSNSSGGPSAMGGSTNGGATAANGGTTATGGSASGGSAATGGSTSGGSTATGGTGGGSGTSACVLPTCLKNFGADCVESGTCTTQTDSATGSSNTCYANGVKEINVFDLLSGDNALTVKKGSSTCFTTAFNGNDVYTGMGSITVKNATGTTVASVRIDDSDSLYKVTCTGSQEVSLDPSCQSVWPISVLMGTTCDDGTCAP